MLCSPGSDFLDPWSLMECKVECTEVETGQAKVAPLLEGNRLILRRLIYLYELDAQVFQDRVRSRFPVVITGLCSEWPAIVKWNSTDYLKSIFGSTPVLLLESKDNKHFFKDEITIKHEMTGEDAVTLILENHSKIPTKDATKWYARCSFLSEFLKDVYLPYELFLGASKEVTETNMQHSVSEPFKQHSCAVWLSTVGNITPLHYDMCHGLLCQVKGQKKVTMFHKDDFRSLYPNENIHVNTHASKLMNYQKFTEGDPALLRQFPLLKDLNPYECILNPGDVLYIPPYFWHYVETVTPSISVILPFGVTPEESVHPCRFI